MSICRPTRDLPVKPKSNVSTARFIRSSGIKSYTGYMISHDQFFRCSTSYCPGGAELHTVDILLPGDQYPYDGGHCKCGMDILGKEATFRVTHTSTYQNLVWADRLQPGAKPCRTWIARREQRPAGGIPMGRNSSTHVFSAAWNI